MQGTLWESGTEGFPRVLSCSILHDEIGTDYARWDVHLSNLPSPVLRHRFDDVGRAFVYSPPRFAPSPPSMKGHVHRTDVLSSRGARAIQGAALKAVQVGKPFRAMWTLSVSDDYLSEFLPSDGYDGSQKPLRTLSDEFRRLRQWIADYCRSNGHKPPVYAYSAESKSDGQRDYHPHLHLLTSLVLKRTEFQVFTSLVEAAWGMGSVHMEIIRKPDKAATYLLKAVAYSVKGYEVGQGRVWGRRWSVSREVRAVEERVTVEQSETFAVMLEEVAYLLRECGKERVQTPYGSVTVRGFYPRDGHGSDYAPLAIMLARSELEGVIEEVMRDASVDSATLPDAAGTSF